MGTQSKGSSNSPRAAGGNGMKIHVYTISRGTPGVNAHRCSIAFPSDLRSLYFFAVVCATGIRPIQFTALSGMIPGDGSSIKALRSSPLKGSLSSFQPLLTQFLISKPSTALSQSSPPNETYSPPVGHRGGNCRRRAYSKTSCR